MRRRGPNYKELTLYQLRSFCETARRGSFAAAAEALQLSHPTVLQQVHALEREFGTKLFETHGRGCELTAAGRLLVELAEPALESITTLADRFQAALTGGEVHLTVAVTPRSLTEELAECVLPFRAKVPNCNLTFLELPDEEVAEAVAGRRADFGYTPTALTRDQQRTLTATPSHCLEVRLIAPAGHPLAARRSIHPRDLRSYPFVNGPDDFSSPHVRPILDRCGAYANKPCAVRAGFVASIRRFVALGFGVGLVPAPAGAPPQPGFFERDMSQYFGQITVYLIRRRGATYPPALDAFTSLVGERLAGGSIER